MKDKQTRKKFIKKWIIYVIENFLFNLVPSYTIDTYATVNEELLLFANRIPLNLNIDNDYSAKTIFAEGHALLYPVSIDSVYGPDNVRMLCGKTPTYIGYPYDEGCGSLAEIAGQSQLPGAEIGGCDERGI
ncbi:MAG: hypothetical protein NC543_09670 [bacterium]|nr:hypothetical protein [bacterium]